jgi:hypothetical protein
MGARVVGGCVAGASLAPLAAVGWGGGCCGCAGGGCGTDWITAVGCGESMTEAVTVPGETAIG